MHVELSREAQERVESLVASGAYPSVEAAVEAAVDALEHPDFEGIDVTSRRRRALDDFAAGRTHEATPEYLADLRDRAEEVIRSKAAKASR
jgi:Arc/MetJ-type ribon-helix-helix transcriptional regulator